MKEKKMITIDIDGHGKVETTRGISLLELIKKIGMVEKPLIPVVGALYNNRIMGLEYQLKRNCKIKFLNVWRHPQTSSI